jgi:3-methyl-2-oxobutanoate hydroxymethyltransferase
MKGVEKISVLTAYDYSTATICDRAGIDILLVGDSAGMVMLGYPSTVPVTLEEMLVFCRAVSRGAEAAMVVGDMPFGSYQQSTSKAIDSAVQFVKAGCDAVKLEGGAEAADRVRAIVDAGIPVMGHIGFRPQTSLLWEGSRLQGKTSDSFSRLLADARALEKSGVFSLVMEMVTAEAADKISKSISIPTIGIGSGPGCDGQVLVVHDALGIYDKIKPRFAKRYADLAEQMFKAISTYRSEVKSGKFPDESNTFHADFSSRTKIASKKRAE